ncbi:zinc-binding dehydrogenase [Streptomyces griseofuscus]
MAEFVSIDAGQFHRLPDDVDLKQGAWSSRCPSHGPVPAVAVPDPGTSFVAGAGPVGIGAWYAFRVRGVEHILVSEPNAERRRKTAALGAHVLDPVAEDLEATVAGLTDGGGVDVFYDAAGAGAALRTGLVDLAPGGRVILKAVSPLGQVMVASYCAAGCAGTGPRSARTAPRRHRRLRWVPPAGPADRAPGRRPSPPGRPDRRIRDRLGHRPPATGHRPPAPTWPGCRPCARCSASWWPPSRIRQGAPPRPRPDDLRPGPVLMA